VTGDVGCPGDPAARAVPGAVDAASPAAVTSVARERNLRRMGGE
jgi:hypothetical protein